MGLTIYYDFRAPLAVSAGEVRELLERWREFARSQCIGDVTTVRAVKRRQICMTGTVWEKDARQNTSIGHEVPVEEGWAFWVQPPGCETLRIALCRYPAWIETKRGRRRTRLDGAWRYQSFCKTQYASLAGWEAFRAAHVGVIDCLAQGRAFGVRVRIRDDGGYWPRRDEQTLRARLDEMNGLVAAVAGAFKDAAEEAGTSGSLGAPILAHPQFEKLEFEGGRHAAKANELVRLAGRERKQRRE